MVGEFGGGGVVGRGSAGLSGFLCASLGNIRRASRRGEYRVASEGCAALCVVAPALQSLREPSPAWKSGFDVGSPPLEQERVSNCLIDKVGILSLSTWAERGKIILVSDVSFVAIFRCGSTVLDPSGAASRGAGCPHINMNVLKNGILSVNECSATGGIDKFQFEDASSVHR